MWASSQSQDKGEKKTVYLESFISRRLSDVSLSLSRDIYNITLRFVQISLFSPGNFGLNIESRSFLLLDTMTLMPWSKSKKGTAEISYVCVMRENEKRVTRINASRTSWITKQLCSRVVVVASFGELILRDSWLCNFGACLRF